MKKYFKQIIEEHSQIRYIFYEENLAIAYTILIERSYKNYSMVYRKHGGANLNHFSLRNIEMIEITKKEWNQILKSYKTLIKEL